MVNTETTEPTHCLICQKGPLKGVRKHMRRVHRALLAWDDDFGWTYIYD